VFLLLFGPAAVGAVFERGKFGHAASGETGRVLIAFSAATFTGSLIAYLVPFIYGLNRFRAIIWVELAVFAVYLAGAPLGAEFWGLTGLATAFAAAQFCGAAVAIDVCRRAVGWGWARLTQVVLVPVLCPVAVATLVQVLYRVVLDHAQLPVGFRGFARVGGGATLLLVAMGGALLLSRLPEAEQLRSFLRRAQSSQKGE
jgi:peptidoglycan biosynthesis protein MviN/MurJ (putative lipid II flippase)